MELLIDASSDCTTGVCWKNTKSREEDEQTDREKNRQTRGK